MKRTASDLIIGYLKGSLNTDEVNQFYDWVNATSENKHLFFETKAIYDVYLSKESTVDWGNSWKRLLIKRKKQTPTSRYIFTFIQKIQVYAAVAIITIILTSTFFFILTDAPSVSIAEYVSSDGIVADKIILSDGTQVSMGSQTKFRYDPCYGKEQRVVYLDGEAFFDVAKQKDKPFIVVVNGQKIEALGTKFNVKAYRADSIIATTLLEGSVCLVSENIETPTVLSPNQQYIYNKARKTYKVDKVEASLYTSWVSGYYYFHEESLNDILGRLGHIYGVRFKIQSDKFKKRKFTGTFYRGQSIKNILDIINISIPIHYRMDDQDVIIN